MREFTKHLSPRYGDECQDILWSLAHCKWNTPTWPDSVTALVSRGWSQTLECSWIRLTELSIDDDAQTNSCSFVDGKSVHWAKEQSAKCTGSAESMLFLSGTYSSISQCSWQYKIETLQTKGVYFYTNLDSLHQERFSLFEAASWFPVSLP